MSSYRECVICQTPAAEPYCVVDGHEYVRCTGCALLYVDPIPRQDAMFGAYTGGWLRALRRRLVARFRKHHHHKNYQRLMQRGRKIFAFAYDALTSQQRQRQLRFLDVGCNKGYLLAAAIEKGAEVYGIELVREIMMPFCNSYPRFKDNIFSEKLSAVAARLGTGQFDVITAIDVVEHLEDPRSDLVHLYRALKPGGVAVIQTPDAGGKLSAEFGGRWDALRPLEHLYMFNRENFARLATSVGFREVQTYEPFEYIGGNFVALLKK